MMHKLKSRQCIAIFVMLILIAAIIAVYIFHVLIWHKFINAQEPPICDYE